MCLSRFLITSHFSRYRLGVNKKHSLYKKERGRQRVGSDMKDREEWRMYRGWQLTNSVLRMTSSDLFSHRGKSRLLLQLSETELGQKRPGMTRHRLKPRFKMWCPLYCSRSGHHIPVLIQEDSFAACTPDWMTPAAKLTGKQAFRLSRANFTNFLIILKNNDGVKHYLPAQLGQC